ncbi:DUF1688-domain-containing protein [Rickenella mellea]|uniref:DUF1688-domain-containing protein n=1 Tax=Rickenella mellea TaxID=50990 RepID=A0A4Y7Q1N4_9AGAM|nr:DUF1688-domain-containing protein [Rickenella mellea]
MSLLGVPSTSQMIAYLRTLPAIRERCARVFALAQQGKLEYFDYHPEKEANAEEFCANIMERDYGSDLSAIPPHGRWRHLDAGHPRMEPLIIQWNASTDDREICKRLVDLFLVSVLLDAGAGNIWTYKEPGTGDTFTRSEGLGVASVHMFLQGAFSGISQQPHRVDAEGLARMTPDYVASAMQVDSANPMTGIDGRANLLFNLGKALRGNPTYFGNDARPGNLIDFLESQSIVNDGTRRVHISALWHLLIDGLAPIWPASRTQMDGISLGDVWPCIALRGGSTAEGEDLVPFHKLTGWTTYSLIEPIQKILKWEFDGLEDMTGLPEYRNGGLLLDFGILSLRPDVIPSSFYPDPDSNVPKLPPSHPAIVEWRAMTVIELDRLAQGLRQRFGLSAMQLTLAQVLESATWKGGREIAKQRRPKTGGPPIEIVSDGTIF